MGSVLPNVRASWLHGERPEWASNRWVHLQGGADSGQCLKLLGVKYGIHPLALEDALATQPQRSKAARFDGHLFLLFPSVAVRWRSQQQAQQQSASSSSSTAPSSESPPLATGVKGAARRLFSSNTQRAASDPSVLSAAAAASSSSSASRLTLDISLVSIVLLTPACDTIITATAPERVGDRSNATAAAAFAHVNRKLRLGYSLLRQSSCVLLLHRLLDALVDEIGPASDALDVEIKASLKAIREAGARGRRLHEPAVEEMHDLQQEAHRLLATVLPLPRVVGHVRAQLASMSSGGPSKSGSESVAGCHHSGSPRGRRYGGGTRAPPPASDATLGTSRAGGTATPPVVGGEAAEKRPPFGIHDEDERALMHDLEDRLETEIFRLQGIVAAGERLSDELRRGIDLETNRVLSTLTIISSIFVPGNFLAAVWGMNFDEMPELHWKYGYWIFWVLLIFVWTCFFLYFKLDLRRPAEHQRPTHSVGGLQ